MILIFSMTFLCSLRDLLKIYFISHKHLNSPFDTLLIMDKKTDKQVKKNGFDISKFLYLSSSLILFSTLFGIVLSLFAVVNYSAYHILKIVFNETLLQTVLSLIALNLIILSGCWKIWRSDLFE